MAISLTTALPYFISYKADNVTPNAGGKIYTWERNTTTNKTAYADAAKTTPLANPIVLDANGGAVIYWDGEYDVRIDTSDDTVIRTIQDFNLQDTGSSSVTDQEGNLVVNGSFEIDTDGDSLPDGWAVTQHNTVAFDTTDARHGTQSLLFTSVGSGGGLITSSAFMNVTGGATHIVKFSVLSSVADVRNLVTVEWFTEADVTISTSTIWDESSSNPTSWAEKVFSVSAPATAARAKITLHGCHSSDATSGTTRYDHVELYEQRSLNLATSTAQTVASAVTITGVATLSSTLAVTGNFNLNTNKFNVAASTGNTALAGSFAAGITTASQDGFAHIHKATAGAVTAGGTANTLVVESNVEGGISILTPDNLSSHVAFGSPGGSIGARITWNRTADVMQIGTNKSGAGLDFKSGALTTQFTLDGDGGLYSQGATGASQGQDTFNVGALYINGGGPIGTGARIYNSAAQTLTTATIETLVFNAENYDDGDNHDTSTNNDRLGVPTGATRVRITGQVEFVANGTGYRYMKIAKNAAGGNMAWTTATPDGTIADAIHIDSGVLSVTDTDYFTIQVYQNSGGNLDTVLGDEKTWMCLEVIR